LLGAEAKGGLFIYICIYAIYATHTHLYIHVCVYIYIYIFIYVDIHVCICICMYNVYMGIYVTCVRFLPLRTLDLHVEYAERRRNYGILFKCSLSRASVLETLLTAQTRLVLPTAIHTEDRRERSTQTGRHCYCCRNAQNTHEKWL